MKRISFLFLLLFFCSWALGQRIQVVLEGSAFDSSFYALSKISANEYWAGGNQGILKRIDSSGNVTTINYPNSGERILKIIKVGDFVFITTDNGVIYRYDIGKKEFQRKEFAGFQNKCFYDLIALKSGQLMVCGGSKGISKGERIIPHGFAATIDWDHGNIDVVWHNPRKFIWSLLQTDSNQVLAASFNGLNTHIIKTSDLIHWKKKTRIKGLVHRMIEENKTIWYCGTRTIRYKKDGIAGQLSQRKNQILYKNTGCLWTMSIAEDHVFLNGQHGEVLQINKGSLSVEKLIKPGEFTLYGIEKISDTKLLIVGHGKSAFILDFTNL